MKPYSYSTLRYRHDPTSGEAVNVGVLLYCPEESFTRLELDDNYGHLSGLFREFSKDDFEMSLQALRAELREASKAFEQPSFLESFPRTATELATRLLPDQGGTLRFGELGRGRGRDLDEETQALFKMLIADQRPEHFARSRRNEEDVWKMYRKVLDLYNIPIVLEEKKIQTPSVSLTFKHTFQNGARHALQPLTLEYAKPEDIIARAAKWKAFGDELAETPGFGRLDLLLGTPDRLSPGYTDEHEDAVEAGIKLLSRTKVEHQIVRENGAGDYAKNLFDEMKAHNVLP